MYEAALLQTLEDAGVAILTLAEGVSPTELLASRLTRVEVTRQLLLLAQSACSLPESLRQQWGEIDWAGWARVAQTLEGPRGPVLDDAFSFAVSALTPATLMWLRVYRQSQPERFRMSLS